MTRTLYIQEEEVDGDVKYIRTVVARYEYSFKDATSLTIKHGLGYIPHVTILSDTNEVITPKAISHTDSTEVKITLPEQKTGKVICSL